MLIINHFLLFYKVKVLICMDSILCLNTALIVCSTLYESINYIDQAI